MAAFFMIILEKILGLVFSLLMFLGLVNIQAGPPTQDNIRSVIADQRNAIQEGFRNSIDNIRELNINNFFIPFQDAFRFTTDPDKDLISIEPPDIENNVSVPVEVTQSPPTITNQPAIPINQNPPAQTQTGNLNNNLTLPIPAQIDPTLERYSVAGNLTSIAEVSVNIICLQTTGSFVTASTGSGVIISPNGVVVTNAHVAQLILLEKVGFDIECSVYRASNKDKGYSAEIVFLPPEWVIENPDTLKNPNPMGTGEHDYALILIYENNIRNLNVFPYAGVNLDVNLYDIDLPILISGFPGGPLNVHSLRSAGVFRTDNSKITDLFTFSSREPTVFSTERTIVAERGASGGGIFNGGSLVGITVTIAQQDGGYRINALTTSYINSAIFSSMGMNLLQILGSDPRLLVQRFRDRHLNNLGNILKANI